MSENAEYSTLTGKTLLLFFDHDKAYLGNSGLSLRDADIPSSIKFFETKAVWEILVTKHNEANNSLHASVVSYDASGRQEEKNPEELYNQLNQIKRIYFRQLNTRSLLRSASGERLPRMLIGFSDNPDEEVEKETVQEQKIRTVQERFSIPINALRFQLGAVSFKRKFWFSRDALDINIKNYELREEFDAVKNYFINALKTKHINVRVSCEVEGDEVRILNVYSPEIDRIDKALIETVRFEFVSGFKRKKSMLEIDQSLFTMDELLAHFGEQGFHSDAFFQSEADLFDDLLQITDTKHYRNLRYLSSIHAHHIMKLRFVLKPFSFVFLVEGAKCYHLIWETLDTEEATYIWSCDKQLDELKLAMRKLDDILNVIKVQGKTAYLNTVEDPFQRIYHDYSDLQDGFLKWKVVLEQSLA